MTRALSFGDLVVCVDENRARSTGADAAAIGIVAELRRADARVLYPRSGRSLWAPLADLRRAADAETTGSLESRIAGLLELLGAQELEFTMMAPGRARLTASHDAILPDAVDRVRDRLGVALLRYVIRPQGMHRIQSVLEFSVT